MRDVAKCIGDNCPRRDQCARFLAPILTEQNWVIVEDPANCDLFKPTLEKPTTDHLIALGYRLTHSVAKGVHVVMRPGGQLIRSSYSTDSDEAWDLAREFVAREIANTNQPKENKP